MTKLDLQKELLEKVKAGVKPSDLKKSAKKPAKKPISPSPISIDDGYQSDPERTILPKDEGYESDNSLISNEQPPKPDKKPGQNTIKNLQTQIQALQKQVQVYQDFKQADLKIKEKYKQEIKELQTKNQAWEQKYSELEKVSKNQVKLTREPQPNEPKEIKTFLCSDCQQTKPHTELSRAFNNFSFCLTCSKKARQQAQQEKTKPTNFTCHSCQQTKQEIPNKMKLDQTLQLYPICSPCRPTLKEFNEADLITDDLWAKYPYSSASEILEKEFNIKKEEPW